MILSGILLHVVVAGALFRPLSFFTRHRKPSPVKPPEVVPYLEDDVKGMMKRSTSLTIPTEEKELPPQIAIPAVYREPLLSNSVPVVFASQLGQYAPGIVYSSNRDICAASSDEESVTTETEYTHKLSKEKKNKPRLDFTIFLNFLYLSYLVSTAANNAAYMNNYLYIPAYVQELGSSKQVASLLLAVSGVCDLFCRLFWGWLADTNLIKRNNLVACCLLVVSVTNVAPTFFPSVYTVGVQVVALGVFGSCYPCLICVVLIDYVGLERMPNALGFSAMAMGLFNTGMTPSLGK